MTGASIIGRPPVAVTNIPSISGTVDIGVSPGSVLAYQGGAWTPSVSGTVNIAGNPSISGTVNIAGNPSISGTVLVGGTPNVNTAGSVVAFQGTDPWTVRSSLAGGIFPVSGSVAAIITNTNVNVGGSVLAFQASTWPGSILALQGTSPWAISSVYGNISGSVLSQQSGTRTTSVVGSIPSSLLTGTYGHRNDAIASFLGGNLTWNPIATDSAGRILIKQFSSEDSTIISYTGSVVSGSVTQIAASAIGLRNYMTDYWVANTGSVSTLITFQDGSTSILGRTIAPAGGGSNSQGIAIPFRTARSQDLAFLAGTSTSVLYMTVKGYQAP